MRALLAIALLIAPIAAEAAEPPLRTQPEAGLVVQRMIRAIQVQIIEIRVDRVRAPRTQPGDCVVTGVVQTVWLGDAFQPGADVTIKVPCNSSARLDRDLSPIEAAAVDPRVVMRSTRACVHLRRSGELVWTGSGRRWGPCNYTSGYTPLDPPPLPADPSSAL